MSANLGHDLETEILFLTRRESDLGDVAQVRQFSGADRQYEEQQQGNQQLRQLHVRKMESRRGKVQRALQPRFIA